MESSPIFNNKIERILFYLRLVKVPMGREFLLKIREEKRRLNPKFTKDLTVLFLS
jgi:hypothetical protein